jgi:hypothetical protein
MMNEQLTLLALKASDPKTGWLDRQKFAELIVRECMNICYRTDTEYEGKKVKSTVIASKVAEHFGVEE